MNKRKGFTPLEINISARGSGKFLTGFTLIELLVVISMLATVAYGADKYEPTWESLSQKSGAPEWLQDAKFGYYFHWGPQTYGDQEGPYHSKGGHAGSGGVPHHMYDAKSPLFKYYKETFGDQNTFGYKDLVKQWKAPKFNAEEWVDTFTRSGARFGGCLAIHCDNIALWDSKVTSWNLKNYGPKRDVLGELFTAYRKRGMKVVATFHHGWGSFVNAYKYDAKDGKNIDLYNEQHKESDPPTERFLNKWAALINEVVDKYSPDGIWFDFGLRLIAEPVRHKMMADFYNKCDQKGIDGVLIHKHRPLFPTGMLDTERGRPVGLMPETFMNDKSIGRRCWFRSTTAIKAEGLSTDKELICALIDLASKNGVLMLSIAPDKDGTIPEDQKKIMLGIGKWLKRNGEAIYNTRPWLVFGEGPFLDSHKGSDKPQAAGDIKYRGGHKPQWDTEYTAEDIRFTRSKDGKTLYAMPMGRPAEGELVVKSFFLQKLDKAKIRLLGYGEVPYKLNEKGQAVIQVPKLDDKEWPAEHPVAFAFDNMTAAVQGEEFWKS